MEGNFGCKVTCFVENVVVYHYKIFYPRPMHYVTPVVVLCCVRVRSAVGNLFLPASTVGFATRKLFLTWRKTSHTIFSFFLSLSRVSDRVKKWKPRDTELQQQNSQLRKSLNCKFQMQKRIEWERVRERRKKLHQQLQMKSHSLTVWIQDVLNNPLDSFHDGDDDGDDPGVFSPSSGHSYMVPPSSSMFTETIHSCCGSKWRVYNARINTKYFRG